LIKTVPSASHPLRVQNKNTQMGIFILYWDKGVRTGLKRARYLSADKYRSERSISIRGILIAIPGQRMSSRRRANEAEIPPSPQFVKNKVKLYFLGQKVPK